jgi:hypothetical protein
MAPELIIPLVSASISSVVGAVAFMITNLSKQRTERVKHRETIDLDRERLRLVMEAYQRDVVGAQAPDLVDLTRALLGSNEPVDYGCDSKFTGTMAPRDAIPPPTRAAHSHRAANLERHPENKAKIRRDAERMAEVTCSALASDWKSSSFSEPCHPNLIRPPGGMSGRDDTGAAAQAMSQIG